MRTRIAVPAPRTSSPVAAMAPRARRRNPGFNTRSARVDRRIAPRYCDSTLRRAHTCFPICHSRPVTLRSCSSATGLVASANRPMASSVRLDRRPGSARTSRSPRYKRPRMAAGKRNAPRPVIAPERDPEVPPSKRTLQTTSPAPADTTAMRRVAAASVETSVTTRWWAWWDLPDGARSEEDIGQRGPRIPKRLTRHRLVGACPLWALALALLTGGLTYRRAQWSALVITSSIGSGSKM